MVTPDDIVGSLNTKWFSSLAGAGQWLSNILISLLILSIFYFTWVLIRHNIKVTIFPVFGGEPDKLAKIKEGATLEEIAKVGVTIGHPIKKKGRDIKVKGVRKFSLLTMPNIFFQKKIRDVPYDLKYPDGIWLLKITNDTYVPMRRPEVNNITSITVPESDLDLWQESAEAEIRRRTQDEDMMKKHLYMTVMIIIGAFVLCGIIIWLSMTFAGNSINAALEKVQGLTGALNNLGGAAGPG